MSKGKGKYTTVHIPTVLADLIDEIIKKEKYAYASRSEFIKDAVRRFLEYYGYYPRKEKLETQDSQNRQEPLGYMSSITPKQK